MASGIKFKHIYTDYLIVEWYKNSSPLALVDSESYDNTYSNTAVVLTPEIVLSGAYTFKFYNSTDGATLGAFITSWEEYLSPNSNKVVTRYEYIGNRGDSETDPDLPQWSDPAIGDDSITDERYADVEIEKTEFIKGVKTFLHTEYEIKSGGGITILNGETFDSDEPAIVKVYSVNMVTSSETGGSTSTTGVNVVTADATLDTDYYGKENYITGSGTTRTTTFPAFSSIPDGTLITFINPGGFRQWVLQFDTGNTCEFLGRSDRNFIVIGQGEKCKVFITTISTVKTLLVLDIPKGYENVGKRILVDRIGPNMIALDGSEGTKDDYLRLYDEHIDQLSTAQIVTFDEWDDSLSIDYTKDGSTVLSTKTVYPNKGFFAVDGDDFIFPDDRNMHYRALKTLDGSSASDTERVDNVAGGYQVDSSIPHKHKFITAANSSNGVSTKGNAGNNSFDGETKTTSFAGTESRGENRGLIAVVMI